MKSEKDRHKKPVEITPVKKRGWLGRFLERLAESNKKYAATGCKT